MKNDAIYKIGAISALLMILGSILDIVIGILSGVDVSSLPVYAKDWFILIEQNWLLALYNLDFLNMINAIMFIPAFYAVCLILYKEKKQFIPLIILIFIIGTTIFINNNAGLAMLDLSEKFKSSHPVHYPEILGAAESLLAKGHHGSRGVFLGFFLPTLASLLLSIAMLNHNHFTKASGIIGVIGFSLLTVYLILVTFIPGASQIALILAMPGGLMSILWMFFIAKGLFQYKEKSLRVGG